MRIVSMVVALVVMLGCGASDSKGPSSQSIVGVWALQSYNGGTIPYTGSVNPNGSVNKVTAGTITFDSQSRYVLDIRITNTLGATQTPNDYAEVGSYTGTLALGASLLPNDVGSGSATPRVPVSVSGSTLSFPQQGKILVFSR